MGRATFHCWAASALWLFCSFCNPSLLFDKLLLCVLAASSCNPAWHKSSTIVSNYLLCSCHNAVRNLQLQSRIGVYCPQPCQCVLSQTVEQERRTKSTSVRAALTMGTISRCSDPSLFGDFYVKASSGQSLVHILSISSSKSAPAAVFFNILKCKATSCHSLVKKNLPTSHLPKVLRTCIFFTIWSENRALADSPVHFSTTTFPDRSAKPRKQRPYFGDPRSHITRQNTGFRAWECFHPCIDTWWHDVDTCWHEDYLMMTRLPLDIRP